jgi:mono/diheme cytochrome c family protein
MNLKLALLILALAIVLFVQSRLANADEGRNLYQSKCVRCHNADPSKKGSVGPDIADSSLELITVRTQKKGYPEGYTPKRKTKIMPIIKLTEAQLKALHTYISSFNKKK